MNYTDTEAKVREATNDDAWGPTGKYNKLTTIFVYTCVCVCVCKYRCAGKRESRFLLDDTWDSAGSRADEFLSVWNENWHERDIFREIEFLLYRNCR